MSERPKGSSRYIVGIDLGTSSSALSYFDTHAPAEGLKILPIPQWVGVGQTAELPLLPSYCYFLEKHEIKSGNFTLPQWGDDVSPDYVVGSFSRDQSTVGADRVIHAAKSWLCHGGVDRRQGILPWHSESILGEKRLSPVQASALYLEHLRRAWNFSIARLQPEERLEFQQIVLTVPASFDEIASALTLEAAELAGLSRENLRLLEEPQAAWYFWQYCVSSKEASPHADVEERLWQPAAVMRQLQLAPGQEQLLLVCDCGGGTTDFSLLAVSSPLEEGKSLEVTRVEVSTHILLGGDNFDLHLAYFIEKRAKEQGLAALSRRQWAKLRGDARWLKEKAFSSALAGEDPRSEFHLGIAPEGARMLSKGASVSLRQGEIVDLVLDGFFPLCRDAAELQESPAGLKEWGLPHPQDCGITRHLAAFLKGRAVDGVLFTGGSLVPASIRARLYAQLCAWQKNPPRQLENSDFELAVCQGAAIFGASVRLQHGQITSGYPRSLYLAVATEEKGNSASSRAPSQLVCVLPKGFAGSEPLRIEGLPLWVVVGQPVAFTLFSSTQRQEQAAAVIPPHGDDLHSLPPLTTLLPLPGGSGKKPGQRVQVLLEVALSATGLLTIYCVGHEDTSLRWPLTFNVQEARVHHHRGAAGGEELSPQSGELPALSLRLAGEYLAQLFGKKEGLLPAAAIKSKQLWQFLESTFHQERYLWDLPLLRGLWELIKEGETRRGRSREHEAIWLSLAGFCLRPGFGLQDDSFRVDRLWQAYARGGPFFSGDKRVEDQWWIMWRRTAGGLDRERQEKIFNKVFPQLRLNQASPEIILLVGSLERVEMQKKLRLAQLLLEQVRTGKSTFLAQRMWALTRISSRRPLYGGPAAVVPPSYVEEWFKQLAGVPAAQLPLPLFMAFTLAAGRKLNDRYLDISEESRELFIGALTKARVGGGQLKLIAEYVAEDQGSGEQLFGEKLPPGLILG